MMTDTHGRPVTSPYYIWIGLDVIPESIPMALRVLAQWVVWKAEKNKDGGTGKVPYQVNGLHASSTNPSTWTDYGTALAAYLEEGSGWDGIGFAVRAEDGILLLDFDHVRDGLTGRINPEALEIISALGTYAEISPSGTGVRVIGFGTLHRAITSRTMQGWVSGRYVTVSGHHLPETPAQLRPVDVAALDAAILRYSEKPATRAPDPRASIPEGGRNAGLTAIGGALRRNGLSQAAIEAALLAENAARCAPPLDDREVLRIASNISQYEPDGDLAHGAAAAAALMKPAPVYRSPEPPDLPSLEAPGILSTILEWGIRTAHKPQPHLALQAAIAVGTVAMARRYRTQHDNWPMLWLLGVAVTASGKEHGKTIVEECLAAAGLHDRISGAGYTSPGAVFSALMDRPAHVALIDEFGKFMEASQAHGNQAQASALTALMEVFGRGHGAFRPMAYSLMGVPKEQRDALGKRVVYKPSITLLAMTTPTTLYENLSQKWITDGFLGRFLVCESPIGRMPSVYPEREPVPEHVTQWLTQVAGAVAGPGDLAGLSVPSDMEPTPILLNFSARASSLLRTLEADVLTRMDQVERAGLESLYGRTAEKAMRLAMVAAMAECPDAREIGESAAQWAIDYVLACDAALVDKARMHVADSDFARIKNRCLDLIRAAGAHGLTPRELGKRSAAFDALRPREQGEIMDALTKQGAVQIQTIETMSGRGRKRQALVAIQEEPDE